MTARLPVGGQHYHEAHILSHFSGTVWHLNEDLPDGIAADKLPELTEICCASLIQKGSYLY
jgi:hypothetical protein